MGTHGVVGVDPGGKFGEPLIVGAVQPAVGPFGEQGLDEALGLAVGLRTMRSDPLVARPNRLDRPLVGKARVGPGVVGEHALAAHALTGKPDRGI